MLVLYLLFPRVAGPLWGLPQDAHAGRSGLSETMAPGNIANLALTGAIAFRVRFAEPVPLRVAGLHRAGEHLFVHYRVVRGTCACATERWTAGRAARC